MARHPLTRATALLTASMMLAACVTTQAGRIGYDDGSDGCRPQLVALDATGDFYGEDILQGAAVGALGGALIGGLASGRWEGALIGAAVGGAAGATVGYLSAVQRQARDQSAVFAQISADLGRENAQLDRTQVAFSQLMDCRLFAAARVRELVATGRMDRVSGQQQLANIRARFQADIQLAQSINGRISARGTEFDKAIDTVVPGGKASIQTAMYRPPPVRVAPRRPVEVKFQPNANSANIARVNQGDVVSVRPGPPGFALVETASGVRGYAPADAFPAQRATARPGAEAPAATGQQAAAAGDVRSLAATNISRRENFAESVGNAERLAQAGGGFELAG